MRDGLIVLVICGALAAVTAPAAAQARERERPSRPTHRKDTLPDRLRSLGLGPGLCRIWLDDVPAAQQPAPTDCATAVRNRPPSARVIFGAADDRGSNPARVRVRPDAPAPSGKPRRDEKTRKPGKPDV